MPDKENLTYARMGYLFTVAILLFTIVSRIMILKLTFEWFLGIVTLLILLFLNLLMLALYPKGPPHMIHLILLSLIAVSVFWYFTLISYFFVSYSTDSIIMSHMGAEMVLQGKNPYDYSLLPYFERFDLPYHFTTLKMDGTITDIITYPAFNFLVFVPFLAFGVTDLRWALLFFHIATLVAIYIFSPSRLRPIVLIPMFMIPVFLAYTSGSVTDIVWVFFLVLSVGFWHSKTYHIPMLKEWIEHFPALKSRSINLNTILSGIFLGFSMSFKQIIWIALPFFLIRLWRENFELNFSQRLRKLLSFCTAVTLPFIVFNIPFIMDSPGDWLTAVAAPLFPMGAPMAPYGIGISILTLLGVSLPESYFTYVTLLTIFISIVTYYLYYDRLRFSMWALLIVIPLFWWRSLPNYFIYWIPPMVLDIACNYKESERISPLPNSLMKNRKKILTSIFMLSVLFLSIHTLNSLSSPEVQSIEFLNTTPIQEEDIDVINHLNVTIQNTGLYPIMPRFGVSWQYMVSNLIYWDILDGPETLFPGDTATYHISTEVPNWFLRDGDVVSLVVNDARNPNILKISPPITSGEITNGFFRYWTMNTRLGLPVYIILIMIPAIIAWLAPLYVLRLYGQKIRKNL